MVESLAGNSLLASSWLDHWLDAVDQLVGDTAPQELKDMIGSGGKAIRFIASQSASLWASSLLMRRDAVLSGIRSLPQGQRQRLRTAPVLGSSSLFPDQLVRDMTEERRSRHNVSLFANVAKLADSAHKVVQNQAAASSAPSSSGYSGYRKNKKKKAATHQAKGQG